MVSAQAIFNVREETAYPYDGYTKESQQQDTWYINGAEIKYKTGSYPVKVDPPGMFDTIRRRQIYQHTNAGIVKWLPDTKKRTRIIPKKTMDTTNTIILCKLREQHNYKLGQIFPGHFEMYSLDTFETKKSIVFKVKNKKPGDTLYVYANYKHYKVYSDTLFQILDPNEKLEESSIEQIELSYKEKQLDVRDGSWGMPVLDFYYQFLHAETLEIEYDAESKKYQLKLVN
ncbi:MAG: hypothetical protein JWP12_2103 [Bacteroidetes bacterium]|nr:hypothetical protein [Bacteroidota bacterium]